MIPTRIKAAFELVYSLEPERMRKFTPVPGGKEIYWTHLYSVYKLCVYWGYEEEEILLAAILHDILEDTSVTFEEVRNKFGEKTAKIVLLCSKKGTYVTFNRKDQDEYFGEFDNHEDGEIRRAARVVKLADRLDNLMGCAFIDDKETLRKYYSETKKYFVPIAKEIGKEKELQEVLRHAEVALGKG